MSILKISAALEKKLAAMSTDLATAYENEFFEPPEGLPYQRVELLPNTPVDHAITLDVLEWRGLFQITLMYPLDIGRGEAQARAQATADHFAPAQTLTETGVRIDLLKTARIAGGVRAGDRWAVPVTVPWSAFRT